MHDKTKDDHTPLLLTDDGGVGPALRPFAGIRYWGKIFLGSTLIAGAASVLLIFASGLKNSVGFAADFTRLLIIGMCGAVGLLGIHFIRWAFSENRGSFQKHTHGVSGMHRRSKR